MSTATDRRTDDRFTDPHRHTSRCYWDHLVCGWRCPPAPRDPAAPRRARDE